MSFVVVTNTPDNIPEDIASEYDIEVNTALASPKKCYDFFESVLKSGKDILFVAVPSCVSSTFDALCSAVLVLKEKYADRKIVLVDTLDTLLGEKTPAVIAAECRQKGLDILKTADKVREFLRLKFQRFTTDDLKKLRRAECC